MIGILSYRWLNVRAKPLCNAEGTITRWYGTSTDIDDAKQLEAEREIVARELDHRIGNLFALVNGADQPDGPRRFRREGRDECASQPTENAP